MLAQKPDSTKISVHPEQVNEKLLESKVKVKSHAVGDTIKLDGFMDKNANGIDDHLEKKSSKGKAKQMGKSDLFIDKNGDGICDGRESAIGLKKAQRQCRGGKK